MSLDYLSTLRAIERALTLCDSPHGDEFEGLREAYLQERERPQEPSPQLPLLKELTCNASATTCTNS